MLLEAEELIILQCKRDMQEGGSKIRFLDSKQREQVGFSFIIDNLQLMTPLGTELKRDIKPFEDKKSLDQELDNLGAFIKAIEVNKKALGEIERVFCKLKDIRNTARRLSSGVVLDDVELYEIKLFSMLIEEIIKAYEGMNLDINSIRLISLREVIEILDPDKKRMPTFYIYESYSEELKKIRAEKKLLEEQIFRERDFEKQETLKNRRLNTVVLEEEEELVVRKQLSEKLSAYAEAIKEDIESVGKLDFIIAKAKLALKYNACKPYVSESMNISLKEMFNPEISELLEKRYKHFTPVNIELSSGVTVVTGANMGGKSVALKTIVLNLLLGQCGFYVFAKEAKISVLGFIYFISDDLQSVCQGLSTFGAEIIKVKEAIEAANHINGFMAFDEFARGTNPKEGLYLVKSICKYLNIYESISLIATHYDGAVEEDMVHYQVSGLKNVDFNDFKNKIDLNRKSSIDIIQELMDYRLERVSKEQEVPKDALNIAKLLGLQKEIVDMAEGFYNRGI